MKIEISEKKGELNWGVQWISADGRLHSEWYQKHEDATKQISWLIHLKRQPALIAKIPYKIDKKA